VLSEWLQSVGEVEERLGLIIFVFVNVTAEKRNTKFVNNEFEVGCVVFNVLVMVVVFVPNSSIEVSTLKFKILLFVGIVVGVVILGLIGWYFGFYEFLCSVVVMEKVIEFESVEVMAEFMFII
jgi:hypothetical protein